MVVKVFVAKVQSLHDGWMDVSVVDVLCDAVDCSVM